MSILIPSTEPGVLEDIGSLLTYNPVVEAYEDCERAYTTVDGVWQEVWPDKISAYVYGAVNETITIVRDGITVETVTTNSSGCSNEKIRLGYGIYTLTGSVSAWTEEQTVDRNTTKFRAMPEGSLYWYGNECTDVTGGWDNGSNAGSHKFGFCTHNSVSVEKYSKLCAVGLNSTGSFGDRVSVGVAKGRVILGLSKSKVSTNLSTGESDEGICDFIIVNYGSVTCNLTKQTNHLDIDTYEQYGNIYGEAYAIWLE